MKSIKIIPAVLLLSACSTTQGPLDPDFGKAVTAATEAQIIDPTPATGAPKADPTVQSSAVQRYKNDEVKQPENESIESE